MWPGLPAVAALLAAAAPPQERIAVVDLESPPAMYGLGAQITQQVVKEALAQKKKVMAPDDVRKALGNKSYDELVKCGEKVACVAQLAQVLGVDRVVLGSVGRDEKNYLLKLWLFDVARLTLVADVDRAILIASRRFQRDAADAIPDFLKGKREAKGTLVITANAKACNVTINGEPAGVAPVTVTLKPGRYEVKVERKAYLPVVRLVDVEANQAHTEEVRMLVVPGQTPEEEKVPELAKKPAQVDETSGFTPRPLTFIAGGLAVVSIGFGIGFGASSSSLESGLLAGYDDSTNVYQGTRQQALDAQSNATVANVAWVAAGAFGALTIVSVILDATASSKPAVSVAPVFTPQGGGLVLGGTF